MSDLLFAIIDKLAEKCGNLFSMGASDGVTPQRPIWVTILSILAIAVLLTVLIYFGI